MKRPLPLAVIAAVLLPGCPPDDSDLEIVFDVADGYDECNICVDVAATVGLLPASGGGLRSAVDGSSLEPAGELDDNGEATICFFPMKPGEHEITVGVTALERTRIASETLQVHPFGYDIGIVKQAGDPETLPFPLIEPDDDNPVLGIGDEGSWDGDTIMMPAVVPFDDGTLMLYGGRGEDYEIGAAWSDDGRQFVRLASEPVMTAGFAGAWSADAVNAPALLEVDGEAWAWFHASAGETIAIGLARSADGVQWTPADTNPVFEPGEDEAWDRGSVGHPAVLQREGGFEMWYASGTLQIGHAVSPDGETWSRYCQNPVFLPRGHETWEAGATKSPEVFHHDGLYHMLYSAGGQGHWQVGHAVSNDGLRWARSGNDPAIPPSDEPGAWDEVATINATTVVDGDDLTIYYTGVSGGPSTIGVATVEGWE